VTTAKFKEFRRGYQPWEHEGGGASSIMGGGDQHSSALDHDFVSTLGGPGSGPADPWEGFAEFLDDTEFLASEQEAAGAAVAAWLKGEGAKSVLEVGSGLGRTTASLLKGGLKVTAVEASPALLGFTKARAKGASAQESDFLTLPPGTFDAVVSLRNAFSRLVVEGQAQAMLAAARGALKPKGALAVAFYNRDALDENALNKVFPGAPTAFRGKRTILYDQWQGHPDGGDRFVWAPLVMVGDHSIDWIRRAIPFKFWRLDEVKAALKEARFEVVATVDAKDGKSPAQRSTRRVEVRARAK
jgi:SAM-dependent methyltransferase